jgi:hypothetical protein
MSLHNFHLPLSSILGPRSPQPLLSRTSSASENTVALSSSPLREDTSSNSDNSDSSIEEVLDMLQPGTQPFEPSEPTPRKQLNHSQIQGEGESSTVRTSTNPFERPSRMNSASYTERALEHYTDIHKAEAAAVSHSPRAQGGSPESHAINAGGHLRASAQASHQAIDEDDPFVVHSRASPRHDIRNFEPRRHKQSSRHVRRQTFGGFSTGGHVPNIDMLATSTRKHPTSRQHSIGPRLSLPAWRTVRPSRASISPTKVSFASTSTSPSLHGSLNDMDYMQKLGYETIMARIAEAHGLHTNVVKTIYAQTNDLKKAEQVVKKIKEYAEENVEKAFEEVANEDLEEADMSFPRNVRSFASEPQATHPSRSPNSPWSDHLRSTRGPSEPDMSIDYTPPDSSRAGKFVKLSREGRPKEALRQEQRRASSALRSRPALMSSASVSPSPKGSLELVAGTRTLSHLSANKAPAAHDHWGDAEDSILASNDPEAIQNLSGRFGQALVRRKLAASLKNGM